MLKLRAVHHIALICSDYARSKAFYTEILGLRILAEHYRSERDSWKLDLALDDQYTLELFSFAQAPQRLTQPEACGLRHLAFAVSGLDTAVAALQAHGIVCEPIRTDPYTQRRFTFFADPDQLPLELYEQ